MSIYTRTGDSGHTGLFGGGRVPKNHPRVAACGTVDEVSSLLGWAATQAITGLVRERLGTLQHDLFAIGAELATPPSRDGRTRPSTPDLPSGRVQEMERWIDEAEEELSPLKDFILPGGSAGAAALHVARTVCRRAEREVVALGTDDPIHQSVVAYLNRLSDLLFTLARLDNRRAGVDDVVWRKDPAGPLPPRGGGSA
jgi:cob(I)alamin adenosyltransferase